MVDDQVSDELDRVAQNLDVFPRSQARIYLGVIDRIKSGIGTINWSEKGQKMCSPEHTGQRSF